MSPACGTKYRLRSGHQPRFTQAASLLMIGRLGFFSFLLEETLTRAACRTNTQRVLTGRPNATRGKAKGP